MKAIEYRGRNDFYLFDKPEMRSYFFQEWRTIPGFEGMYEVSNFAMVRSISRTVKRGNHTMKLGLTLIRTFLDRRGYRYVRLCRDGASRNFSVHRLVAKAFIPNPENLPCVNHIDMNPRNNSIQNLEWCTQLYNMQEAHRIKGPEWYAKIPKALGPRKNPWKAPFKKVSQYSTAGDFINTFESIKEAVQKTGTNRTSISECLSGRHKTGNNFIWRLA